MKRPARQQKIATSFSLRGLFHFFLMVPVLLLFVLGSFLFAQSSQAATGINRTINFQGKVVNKSDGTNVTSGNYTFVFSIYSASSGGSQLWGPETQTNVTVTNGIFQVALGSVTSFGALDFNQDNLWLDITFNGENFGSRVRLAAVPYALTAEKVAGLTVTNNGGNTLTIAANKTFTVNNSLTLSGTDSTTMTLPSSNTTLAGLSIAQTFTAAQTVQSNSATALTVGANGSTNPVLQIDASTGSVATGLKIAGAATGGTTALTVIDSGTNANLSINAKGSGTVTINNSATGGITLGATTTLSSGKALIITGGAGDPTATTGTVWYDTTANKFKIVENGTVKILCNTTDAGCGAGGSGARLDQITAATATSSIDSLNNGITWGWSTLTTQTGLTLTGGTAMTTGSVLGISSVTYKHTANESDAALDVAFADATNTTNTSTTDGLKIVPTLNLGASATSGTKTVNGLEVVSPTLTSCTSGSSCTVNDATFNTATTGFGSNITQNALNIAATGISSGTLNGINISNITGAGGSETAINIGSGWDNAISANGDISLGQQANTTNMQNFTKITGTAGTIGGGTAGVASISAAVVFNGSLYVGTNNPNSAEIYRYNGDALGTWTKVSGTAGTVGGNATTAIDMISSLVVYNGYLYAGTQEADKAEVYRYEGGSTWTELNPTGTAGKFLTTTAIDGVTSMAVFGGRLFIGTREPASAEIYMYNGGTTWIAVNGTKGTFVATNTIGVDAITSMVVINNQLIAGTLKTGDADVIRWNGIVGGSPFFALNLASTTGSYLIDNSAQTGTNEITAMTVWAGKLIIAMRRGANQADILMYQEPPAGVAPINSWTRLNSAAGTIGTANIDSVTALTVYGGRLYAGTTEPNSAEVYRYDGEKSWTKVSQNTAGQIATGGTTAIDGIATLIPYNDSLFAGTNEGTTAEGYSYSANIDQSYALKFTATASQDGGAQNGLQNVGQIYFVASLSANLNNKQGNTGAFVFSHSIVTNTGSYDVAEDYPTRDDTLEPGDVVSVDTNERGFVVKSSGAYDYTAIGVYSEKPALRLSQEDVSMNGGIPVPIALAGRVPVKVSTENGDIQPGDPLTPSDTPGVAMKAKKSGLIIGTAMEPYAGEGVGKVLAYIKSTSYDGSIAQSFTGIDPTVPTFGNDVLTALATQAPSVGTSSVVTDRVIAGIELVTPRITADTIVAKTIKADSIEGLSVFTDKLGTLADAVDALKGSTATATSVLAASTTSFATDSGNLVFNSLTITSNATVSGDLRIKGNGLFEGILHVVDTLMTNNFITNGVADFFGTVIFHGDTSFEKAPTFSPNMAGFAIIHKNADHVDVVFQDSYPVTPVVNATMLSVTPPNDLQQTIFGQGYSYIVTNVSAKGFTVILNKKANNDVEFSWNAFLVPSPTIFESATSVVLTPEPTGSQNVSSNSAF